MSTPINLVLSKLKKVSGCYPSWTSRCPAHQDNKPSLSIRAGKDEIVLLHCHAGCSTESIAESLGLEMSDLFPGTLASTRSLEYTADYTDEEGTLIHQVLKYRLSNGEKTFRQRQPDGNGGWIWNLKDVRRVPYRLSLVLDAISRGETVFITEGEGDVRTIESFGHVATCCSGGSKSWKQEFRDYFDGAYVILCGDNDSPGFDYLQSVARSLTSAASIKRIDLPLLVNDVSEWKEKGGNKEAFDGMVCFASDYEVETELLDGDIAPPTADHYSLPLGEGEMMKMIPMWGYETPPDRTWLVDQVLPEGHTTIIAADGGTGKSYLALCLAFCTISGLDFFGRETQEGKVLFVDYELDDIEHKRRWSQILAGFGTDQNNPALIGQFYYIRPKAPLSDPSVIKQIVDLVRENDIKLVILDSLTIALGADATDQRDVTRVMNGLREWGTVLAIDHVSGRVAKGNVDSATPFGSVFKKNMSRSMLALTKVDGGGQLLSSNKNNFGPEQDLIAYEMTFSDDGKMVSFKSRELTHESMIGALDKISTYDITFLALCELSAENPNGLVSASEIVGWRIQHDQEISERTARNHFSTLKRRGKAENVASDQWKPILKDSSLTDHAPLGVMNSDRPANPSQHMFQEGQRVISPKGHGTIVEAKLSTQGKLPVRRDNSMDVDYFLPSELKPSLS